MPVISCTATTGLPPDRVLAALLRITGRPVFCGDLRKALAGLAAA